MLDRIKCIAMLETWQVVFVYDNRELSKSERNYPTRKPRFFVLEWAVRGKLLD